MDKNRRYISKYRNFLNDIQLKLDLHDDSDLLDDLQNNIRVHQPAKDITPFIHHIMETQNKIRQPINLKLNIKKYDDKTICNCDKKYTEEYLQDVIKYYDTYISELNDDINNIINALNDVNKVVKSNNQKLEELLK